MRGFITAKEEPCHLHFLGCARPDALGNGRACDGTRFELNPRQHRDSLFLLSFTKKKANTASNNTTQMIWYRETQPEEHRGHKHELSIPRTPMDTGERGETDRIVFVFLSFKLSFLHEQPEPCTIICFPFQMCHLASDDDFTNFLFSSTNRKASVLFLRQRERGWLGMGLWMLLLQIVQVAVGYGCVYPSHVTSS